MDDVYGYIYKITNKLDGKSYIGQKKSTKLVEHYWGSGDLITAAIRKYGIDNFDREILEWCNSKEELNTAEIYWIKKFNTIETGYNLSPGGNGGYLGPEAAAKVSAKLKLYFSNPENRKKQSKRLTGVVSSRKGKTAENDEAVKRFAEQLAERYANGELIPGMTGKKHKVETLELMSACKMGELNPFYGHHHSQESKDSMSKKLTGHIVTEEQRRKISEANSGKKNGMYGKKPFNANKISITDGVRNKYIKEEDLSEYIAQGWRKGNTQNHSRKK